MPVNVALLGSGVFALNAHLPALLKSPSATLHTVWSRTETSAQKLCDASKLSPPPKMIFGDSGLEKVLADPEVEAVIIVLPIERQPEYIRKAWAAGKHVLSEKPVAPDVESAKGLIREYEEKYASKGLIWRVAENFAHEPMIHEARRLLADPKSGLGPVLYWSVSFQDFVPDATHRYQSTSWRVFPAYQGGFLYDGGVHYAAMLRTILPIRPASVVGITALHRTHLPPNDHLMALCLGPSGSSVQPHGPPTANKNAQHTLSDVKDLGSSIPHGTFTLSVASPNTAQSPTPYGVVITCLNGIVSLLQSSAGWTLRVEGAEGSDVKTTEKTGPDEGVNVEVEMWAKAISGQSDEPDYGRPRDTLWDVAFIQACLNSKGKQVELSSLATI